MIVHCSALAVCLWAAAVGPGLLPLHPNVQPADWSQVRLRGEHTLWLWAAKPGQPIELKLQCHRVGRYTDGLSAAATGPGGRSASAQCNVGESCTIRLRPHKPGLVEVSATAGANSYSVVSCTAPLAVEATYAHRLHVIGAGKLYIYVPAGASMFGVTVRGGGRGENARLRVLRPDGSLAAECQSIGGAPVRALVGNIPDAHVGKLWTLQITKADEGTLEDVYIWLDGDVSPYVCLASDGALVPFCTGLMQAPRIVKSGQKPVVRIRISSPAAVAGGTVRAELTRAGRRVLSMRRPVSNAPIAVPLPSSADASYVLRVTLSSPALGTMTASAPVELRNNVLYVGGLRSIIRLAADISSNPEKPVRCTCSIGLMGFDAASLSLEAQLYRCGISEDPLSPRAQPLPNAARIERRGSMWTITFPADATEGTYEAVLTLRAAGKPLAWQRVHWVVFRGLRFPERRPLPAVVPPSKLMRQRLSAFVPADQDAMPYNYVPSADEIGAPLRMQAARGQIACGVVGLFATRPLRDVSLRLSAAGASQRIFSSASLRLCGYWAQRTSWNSPDMWVVPELILPAKSISMRPLQVVNIWITAPAPRTQRPGRYEATLLINAPGQQLQVPIVLEVLPFELRQPRERHWGIYTDSGRWRRYSREKVRAELADYRAHGITSLMAYPLTHSKVTYEAGKPHIDASEFVELMDMAMRQGLREPTVFSFQALAGLVNRLLANVQHTQEQWDRLYRDIALYYADLAKRRRWGEVVFHAIDEPNTRRGMDEAIHWLGVLKRAGLTTFTTALSPPLINGPLDPFLDVRCWSVGYVLASKSANERAWADARRSGDRLWYYGSGCYTGQEGSMAPNRWLTGFGFYISGAEGEWSWTFLRPKQDPFNDFDGERYREAKDAMIAYPSQGDGPPIPTPQWEGIREGVYDFCYLWMARQAAQRARGARGRILRQRLDRLVESLPWGVRPPEATCRAMNAWRAEAAAIIMRASR